MKAEFPETVERGRLARSNDPTGGETPKSGAFRIRYKDKNYFLFVIASDGGGWDHVSVSVQAQKRTPTWEEMCWIKDQFFELEEAAVQYHPARSSYVNLHEHTLHIWRPQAGIVTPPRAFV